MQQTVFTLVQINSDNFDPWWLMFKISSTFNHRSELASLSMDNWGYWWVHSNVVLALEFSDAIKATRVLFHHVIFVLSWYVFRVFSTRFLYAVSSVGDC